MFRSIAVGITELVQVSWSLKPAGNSVAVNLLLGEVAIVRKSLVQIARLCVQVKLCR